MLPPETRTGIVRLAALLIIIWRQKPRRFNLRRPAVPKSSFFRRSVFPKNNPEKNNPESKNNPGF
jgi:hypothetical protein